MKLLKKIECSKCLGTEAWKILTKHDPFKLRKPHTQPSHKYFVAPFHKDRLNEFINHDKPNEFFMPAERSRLGMNHWRVNLLTHYEHCHILENLEYNMAQPFGLRG